MDYQYDIFVSYRRHSETRAWIENNFRPLLELHVDLELGRRPTFFIDDQLEVGASWPAALGTALGVSRTLIALWTKNYLASVWCTQELGAMLEREERLGLRSAENPYGVVIPAFVHDGESFPPSLSHIQHFDIKDYFKVRMARTGELAQKLEEEIVRRAPNIAACIQRAPPWDSGWPREAAAQFMKQFHQPEAVQQVVPRFTRP